MRPAHRTTRSADQNSMGSSSAMAAAGAGADAASDEASEDEASLNAGLLSSLSTLLVLSLLSPLDEADLGRYVPAADDVVTA